MPEMQQVKTPVFHVHLFRKIGYALKVKNKKFGSNFTYAIDKGAMMFVSSNSSFGMDMISRRKFIFRRDALPNAVSCSHRSVCISLSIVAGQLECVNLIGGT